MLPSDPGAERQPTATGADSDPERPSAESERPSAGSGPSPVHPGFGLGSFTTVRPPERRSVAPIHLALAVVALLAGAALFLSGYSLGARTATTPGTPVGEEQLFAPFWDAYRAVTEEYVGDVDRKALIEGAIKGMIEALGDPYSSYMTSEEFRRSLEGIGGQFEGIGAEVSTRPTGGSTETSCSVIGPECQLVIIAPIAGSPAEKAGVRAGDAVIRVDGAALDGLTIDEAVARIRGEKGTEVVLTVVRDGSEPFDIPIVRDVIVQQEVVTRDLAGGRVAYIRLTGFSGNSARAFKDALAAALEKDQRRIILDLRDNPGGYVDAARTIASQFIAEGPIYWQEYADGRQVEVDAEPDGIATDPGVELIVLINQGSASASEIVAGALRDTGRARLVGETTFGKGTVQEWHTLPDDTGGFRLTISKWLTPEKRWVHDTGIAPDVSVEVPADTPAGTDPVLDRAVELLDTTAALDLAA